MQLTWSSTAGQYQTSINSPGLNANSYAYLVLRVGQSSESSNPSGADQDLRIVVQDTNGGSVAYNASALSRLLYPDTGGSPVPAGKTVMQTLRVPINLLRSQGVNINNISVIKLALDQVSTGRIYFDELQVSK